MHFPSMNYPLAYKNQSYAYPVDCADNEYDTIREAVEFLSTEWDILIEVWQPNLEAPYSEERP